jgi:hypothetical protein
MSGTLKGLENLQLDNSFPNNWITNYQGVWFGALCF